MAFEIESFRVHMPVLQILLFLFFVSLVVGQDVDLVKRPAGVFAIEGETTSATCVGKGPIGKIEFWRKNTAFIPVFEKLNNTDRVYATSKTEGDITTAVLHFRKVELSDESAMSERRYSCRLYNKKNVWVTGHDFNVNIIKLSDLPTALPNSTVVLDKNIGEPQQLKCNITSKPSTVHVKLVSMYWVKDGVVIDQVDARKEVFEKGLDHLKFDELSVDDAGTYTCIVRTTLQKTRDYNVTGGPFILNIIPKIKENRKGNTIETTKGKAVIIQCSASGNPLVLEWKVKPKYETNWKTITEKPCNETRYCMYENKKKLEIKDVQYSDRGFYNCCVNSSFIKEKNYCQEFVLRVRDPLGPLWPVIGIVVEALVLFLIIYFTQKKKNSKAGVEKVDARAEFSYSSTDEGDKGHVRLRSNAEKSDAQKDAET